jgi:hypothetical protein
LYFLDLKVRSSEIAGKLLIDLLENKRLKVDNTFTVIEKESIRQRTY